MQETVETVVKEFLELITHDRQIWLVYADRGRPDLLCPHQSFLFCVFSEGTAILQQSLCEKFYLRHWNMEFVKQLHTQWLIFDYVIFPDALITGQ